MQCKDLVLLVIIKYYSMVNKLAEPASFSTHVTFITNIFQLQGDNDDKYDEVLLDLSDNIKLVWKRI